MKRFMPASAVSLAVGYVALGIVALVLFAAPLWYAWHVTIQEGRAEILQDDAQRLTDVFTREGAAGLRSYIQMRINMKIAGERILLLTDASLRPLAGNLAEWPDNVPAHAGTYTLPIDNGGHVSETVLVRAVLPDGYNLLVARDVARFQPLERRFWDGLAAAAAVLSVAGLIAGLLVRGAVMARIHSMRQTVSAIINGDLKHRLPSHQSGDELNTLSCTINGMLDQIELLIHGVRNVSNAIAHDLRTPLMELRSRLEELALTRPPVDAAFAEVDAAVADVDRVIRIFDALLRLAEIDSGLRRSGFVAFDLAAVAAAAVEFYQPAAELKNIELSMQAPAPVPVAGDPLLLAQALGNLIDNALKYAPVGGRIRIAATHGTDGGAELTVTDNGPGIADVEKPKVVERFYRGDMSRGTPGVGLGLSLVQAVAKLHGTTLELLDSHPGLEARLVLPANTVQGTSAREPVRGAPAVTARPTPATAS